MLLAVAVAVAVAVDVDAAYAAAVDDVAEAPMMMVVDDDTPMEMDEHTPECHDAMVPWSIGPAGRGRLACFIFYTYIIESSLPLPSHPPLPLSLSSSLARVVVVYILILIEDYCTASDVRY